MKQKIQKREHHFNLISKKTLMYQNPQYQAIGKIDYISPLQKLLDPK